jgi:peptidoglycan hydrolase-like protein with peptidoglycan-binding domain
MGHDVGRIDGVLGLKSRVAVRAVQIKLGMPADGWPTPELLQRLRGGR